MKTHPWQLALAGLALAGLACQTVTTLPQRLSPGLAPTPVAAPAATPPDAGQVAGDQPQTFAAGPTVGTPRETRVAMADQIPTLEDLAEEIYAPEELDRVGAQVTYTVQLDDAETRALWGYGWCASDLTTLTQNLDKMRIEFFVNGEAVNLTQFDTVEGQNSEGLACRLYRVVVYDWPSSPAVLETRVTFLEALNDGIGDYPAGEQSFTYEVSAP